MSEARHIQIRQPGPGDCPTPQQDYCRGQFGRVLAGLERIDTTLRGDMADNVARPGVLLRLDRLEGSYRFMARCLWILMGAAGTEIVSRAVHWLGPVAQGAGN